MDAYARLLLVVSGFLGLALCVFAGCITILASGSHEASPNPIVSIAAVALAGGISNIIGFFGGLLANPSIRQPPQREPGVYATQPPAVPAAPK